MPNNPLCCDCTARLTDEEEHYYSIRCERCERELSERLQAWRDGGDDQALDRAFGLPDMPAKLN